jgi:hypothetical protein
MPLFIRIIAVAPLCSFYNMKYAYKCNEMVLRSFTDPYNIGSMIIIEDVLIAELKNMPVIII